MIPCNAAARLWSLPFPDFDSVLVSVRRESWLLKNGLRDTGITCENYTQESHARVGPHLFASAQRAEVLACFWCYLVPEFEDDAALILD